MPAPSISSDFCWDFKFFSPPGWSTCSSHWFWMLTPQQISTSRVLHPKIHIISNLFHLFSQRGKKKKKGKKVFAKEAAWQMALMNRGLMRKSANGLWNSCELEGATRQLLTEINNRIIALLHLYVIAGESTESFPQGKISGDVLWCWDLQPSRAGRENSEVSTRLSEAQGWEFKQGMGFIWPQINLFLFLYGQETWQCWVNGWNW